MASFVNKIIIRPHEKAQHNISDILNDFIYLSGTFIILLMQHKGLRSIIPSIVLIYMLICNCMMVCLINLWFFIVEIIRYLKQRKKSRGQTTKIRALQTDKITVRHIDTLNFTSNQNGSSRNIQSKQIQS